MRYTPREADPVFDSLETVVRGLGMTLIELTVSRGRETIQIRAAVDKGDPAGSGSPIGTDDCSRVHRAILPRLELAFPGRDLYVEVSSPGINRLIKDGAEFRFYLGRGVRCYRTDSSGWIGGILLAADSQGITLKGKEGVVSLSYGIIGKARLEDAALLENGV
ncbi:MAG: ribosome assembly cofactor RimP [Treponema sp.]|jgi:ribosome maturation factor RimP|nr:ribosome assembly cofactor RimP [Treponema sp.]